MRKFLVTKMDGTWQAYNHDKVIHSITATGLALALAEKIAAKVESKLFNKITTRELYRLVAQEIKNLGSPRQHSLYRLREALSELDSIKFEEYLAEILTAYGYQTEWNKLIRGAAVEHQVDVVAKKGAEDWLIEIKHHVDWHKMSGLGQVLQIQARLEDIQEGFRQGKNQFNFTGVWLINNTKFSDHAKAYATYHKIRLSGWHYSDQPQFSLENLIQQKGLYPVTILDIPVALKNLLQSKNLVTLNDLLKTKQRFRMNYSWSELLNKAQAIIQ
ncbi:MAG: restriction endonuclease [Candidatus Buchananbacteria bacterium]